MKYMFCILLFFLWAVYMIAYASTSPSIEVNDVMCPYDYLAGEHGSGLSLAVSEVWFDGTVERIEITNMWYEIYSWNITISGVKATPLVVWVQLSPMESVLVWDGMEAIWSGVYAIRSQWLSISDSTWFTVTIQWDFDVFYSYSFDKSFVASQPNQTSMWATRSWSQQRRETTPEAHTLIVWYPYRATPGYVFCVSQLFDDGGEDESVGDGDFWGDQYGWDVWLTGDVSLTWDALLTWDAEHEPIDDKDREIPIELPIQPLPLLGPTPLWCLLTEIYSRNDEFPEYIELYCPTWFSGDMQIQWLWVGSATKTLHGPLSPGFTVLASSFTWFLYTGNVRIVEWLSLRDDGEVISLLSSWFITAIYNFPTHPANKSYYPLCNTTWCFVSPSPWFPHEYYQKYMPPAPVCESLSSMSTSSPATSKTTTASVATAQKTSSKENYYRWLYEKRKATATWHAKTISWLRSEQKKAISTITALQKKIVTLEAQIEAVKTSAPKTTKKTATPPKSTWWTISKTSKSYITMVDENKYYKWYVDYLHWFLKKHLYTQHKTLWIDALQKNFAKWLASIRKQEYEITTSWWANISVFEYYIVQGSWWVFSSWDASYTASDKIKNMYKRYRSMAINLNPILNTLSSISRWRYSLIWLQKRW